MNAAKNNAKNFTVIISMLSRRSFRGRFRVLAVGTIKLEHNCNTMNRDTTKNAITTVIKTRLGEVKRVQKGARVIWLIPVGMTGAELKEVRRNFARGL